MVLYIIKIDSGKDYLISFYTNNNFFILNHSNLKVGTTDLMIKYDYR